MERRRSIMIVAGEASGDLHASYLIRALRRQRSDLRFAGMGGDRMREAGADLIVENREIAVTGISEVLAKGPAVLRAFGRLRRSLDRDRPDLLILIDFPDFNLRLGRAAARRSIPILYYISPQVWAWRRGRIRKIRRLVEKIMVILPFEADLYGEKGIFVGHPLLDIVRPERPPEETRTALGIPEGAQVVALLPGSRANEIRRHLPVFLEAGRRILDSRPGTRFLLPLAATVAPEEVEAAVRESGLPVRTVRERGYDAVALADAAIAASGTATLETAILRTPMVIVYKMSALSFFIARRLVRVPHIGLINMVAGERIVPELIQDQVTPEKISREILAFLEEPELRARVSRRLGEAVSRLGSPGASDRAAACVLRHLEAGA